MKKPLQKLNKCEMAKWDGIWSWWLRKMKL